MNRVRSSVLMLTRSRQFICLIVHRLYLPLVLFIPSILYTSRVPTLYVYHLRILRTRIPTSSSWVCSAQSSLIHASCLGRRLPRPSLQTTPPLGVGTSRQHVYLRCRPETRDKIRYICTQLRAFLLAQYVKQDEQGISYNQPCHRPTQKTTSLPCFNCKLWLTVQCPLSTRALQPPRYLAGLADLATLRP
ncbi:hypothetical protein F4861DRAFT_239376 [Xylaria intraflava]|nr:hypothetical protein F4861DRAFT_239376 [Xylaria intraflava]